MTLALMMIALTCTRQQGDRRKQREGGMAGGRKSVNIAGMSVNGVPIDIVESTDRFSEVKLADGTTLKTKMVALEVVRLDNQWDADGNPVYHLKSQNIVVADTPLHLKKGGLQL